MSYKRKSISIDFGNRMLHFVVGLYKNSVVNVQKAFTIDIPAGSIADGRIEDPKALQNAIRNGLQQHKIKVKEVIITVQSSSVITRDIIVPILRADDLSEAVKYEMEQYISTSIYGYIVEYRIIEELTEDNTKKYRIRSAAMPKEMAESYFELVRQLKLKPVALDIHPNAVSKLLSSVPTINLERPCSNLYAFIDLGHKTSNIHIFSKGKLEFTRTIAFGGRDIDVAISESVTVPIDKAEYIKINELQLDEEDDNSQPAKTFNDSIQNSLNQLLNETQKVFQYYTNRVQGGKIDCIYIYGGISKMKKFSKYLEEYFNICVRKLHSLSNVDTYDKTGSLDLVFYVNALGAIIRL